MKIHSFAVLLAVPFFIMALFFAYFVFIMDKSDYFLFLLVPVLILTVIYVLSPQIDFWWYSKYPQRLTEKERLFLEGASSFYSSLETVDKIKFEKRAYVFMRSKEFKLMLSEAKTLPEDIKLLIVANAIQITFGHDDFLYADFDRYFAYMHAFPSPKMKFLHSVEVDFEDRVAIFNIEALSQGMNFNNNFFNIGLYAFAMIFVYYNTQLDLPGVDNSWFWEQTRRFKNMDKNSVTAIIGYEPPSLIPVMITLFFMYNKRFKQVFPGYYEKLADVFNIS